VVCLREKIITDCFNSWIKKDASAFRASFADDVSYIESWGPAYNGIGQVMAWFEDWNRENRVLVWDIKKFYHVGDTCICEWYFECDCGGNIDGFNGVSVIDFDEGGKIVALREFQAKTPNDYPYA